MYGVVRSTVMKFSLIICHTRSLSGFVAMFLQLFLSLYIYNQEAKPDRLLDETDTLLHLRIFAKGIASSRRGWPGGKGEGRVRLSMGSRREVIVGSADEYRKASKKEKGQILNDLAVKEAWTFQRQRIGIAQGYVQGVVNTANDTGQRVSLPEDLIGDFVTRAFHVSRFASHESRVTRHGI